MQRFDNLIIDSNNIAYRTFNHKSDKPSSVSKKMVYKKAVGNFIQKIEYLVENYLHSDGKVYLLFDNPTSRIDMQSSFYYADRKDVYSKYKNNREKESKEFYNSLDLVKFYYLVSSPSYRVCQISNLEADDLVKPILDLYCKDQTNLLITNDMDWTRYIDNRTYWMPTWDSIEGKEDLEAKYGFTWSDTSVILFKAIFGDSSDHIPSIASASYRQYFSSLLSECSTPETAIQLSYSDDNIERLPILKNIRDNMKQFTINLQLVNVIPVHESHIRSTLSIGRNSEVSQKAVRLSIGLDSANKSFVFGNVKRPRE